MIRESLSFRNLIALVCIMQCFMNPVSSIQCIQCMANEDGVCIEPSEPEDYKVDCAEYIEKHIKQNREQLKSVLGNLKNLPKEYVCSASRGKWRGVSVIAKACVIGNCDIMRKGFTTMGYEVQSCETCDSDYCN